MQINEAKIFNFGKLQQREFRFGPGINVVYGPNEAGKSTLHDFLVAMLFGMEKNRGRASKDGYLRYEPWHAPAYYSGALRFTVEGRPFYLERNFYHREKRELLRNEADGEELSVAYGDLSVLLGGIGKETFGNTYDIPQSGAVTGKELAGVLAEYLADAAESGEGGMHVARAIENLNAKKKKFNLELKNIHEKKAQEKRELRMERELLERDCAKLKSDIESVLREQEREIWNQPGEAGKEEHPRETGVRSGERLPLFAGMAFVGMGLANCGIFHFRPYPEPLFWGIQCLLGAVAAAVFVLTGKYAWMSRRKMEGEAPAGRKNGENSGKQAQNPEMADSQTAGAAEAEKRQARRMLVILKESLDEKETRLYNISEHLAELEAPGEREREITADIKALELAAGEIVRLSRVFCEELEDELSSEVSRYVSAITGGAYDSVRVDENGALKVLTDGKEVPPDALSRGTLEQFYLAFRLAVGNVVTKEEPMPVFLDETFSMYDDRRLGQALKVLSDMGRQVILFTCQNREMLLLDELGIRYHKVGMNRE